MSLEAIEDRRRVTIELKPGQTIDTKFPFVHKAPAEKASILLRILAWHIGKEKHNPFGTISEREADPEFTFTWPEGITGTNPRNPSGQFREGIGGAFFGDGPFQSPLNVCSSTSIDESILKVRFRQIEGGVRVETVTVDVEVRETYLAERKETGGGGGGSTGQLRGGGHLRTGNAETGLVKLDAANARHQHLTR